MFEFLNTASSEDAITILKDDHNKVKDLFEQFEKAEDQRTKKKIVAEAVEELKIHAEIEEKIFYPAVRAEVGKDIMNEADEEHHVAKLLIAELDHMDGSEDHWEAKFTVLSENIKHHIREEESDMLPKARGLSIDFEALGNQMLKLKTKLKREGIPESSEGKLMVRGVKADSPAKAARIKPSNAKVIAFKRAKPKPKAKVKIKPKASAAKKKTSSKILASKVRNKAKSAPKSSKVVASRGRKGASRSRRAS